MLFSLILFTVTAVSSIDIGLAEPPLMANNSRSFCSPRNYGNGGTVCVCNKTYCDTFDQIVKTDVGIVTLFESNRAGDRFKKEILKFSNISQTNEQINGAKVTINRDVKYQKIIGFGGAFTDATGINILSLDSELAQNIIYEYYSSDGLSYSMGRIPIAGSDFSTRKYTYDDNDGDLKLESFNLTKEDLLYKIPLIKMAKNISSKNIKLFASPWSAPAWMKTNNDIAGQGRLKGEPGGEYYKAWAKYFVKFLNAYKNLGIELWGITTQNEPFDGELPAFQFNCMGFNSSLMRDFINKDLGPTLKAEGYDRAKLNLMIIDDQRPFLNTWANTILGDNTTAQYVSGIAFHWYLNSVSPPTELDTIHNKFPDYFLLSTEACEGSDPFEAQRVSLGNWNRAETYAYDIITDLQHFTSGWIDWNLALDEEGGPNWANNYVDAPIIVNQTANEYYKQPMFYALAHFSKFLPPNSVRVNSSIEGTTMLETVVFQDDNNATILIALNRLNDTIPLTVIDPNLAKLGNLTTKVAPHSIQSYIWYY